MPTLLRELAAPFASDPDYEALQTAPAATINLVNGGGGLIGLFVVADNGGAACAIYRLTITSGASGASWSPRSRRRAAPPPPRSR